MKLFGLWRRMTHSLSNLPYLMLTNQIGQSVSWMSYIWFKGCIRKNFVCGWMMLLGCLKTKAFLLQWNIQCDSNCALCVATWVSGEHLTIHCPFSMHIWRVLLQKLCLTSVACNNYIEKIESITLRIDQNHRDLQILVRLFFFLHLCGTYGRKEMLWFSEL